MDTPKISFIIAVYNGECFIEECINSCLEQTYSNIEVCVTDDGSTDNTHDILIRLYKNNKKVKIDKLDENKGKVIAFNRSYENSSGDFFVFLGADDVNYTNRIEKSLRFIYKNPNCDLLLGSYEVTDYKLKFIEARHSVTVEDYHKEIILEKSIASGGAMLMSKKLAEAVFPIPEKLRFEDWWLNFIAIWEEFNIHTFNEILFKYRQHSNNTIGISKVGSVKDHERHIAYHNEMIDFFKRKNDLETVEKIERIILYKKITIQKHRINKLKNLIKMFNKVDRFLIKSILDVIFAENKDIVIWKTKRFFNLS